MNFHRSFLTSHFLIRISYKLFILLSIFILLYNSNLSFRFVLIILLTPTILRSSSPPPLQDPFIHSSLLPLPLPLSFTSFPVSFPLPFTDMFPSLSPRVCTHKCVNRDKFVDLILKFSIEKLNQIYPLSRIQPSFWRNLLQGNPRCVLLGKPGNVLLGNVLLHSSHTVWILHDLHSAVWIQHDLHSAVWILHDLHSAVWIQHDLHSAVWIQHDLHSTVWIQHDLHSTLWIQHDLHSALWV